MPEDQLPVEDGAVTANPTQDQTETTDWQKRYTDTHANWNELNERMSRFKSDPNAVIEFIRETHPDLLTDDDPDVDDDVEDFEPDEEDRPLTRAEFNAWKAETEQSARQQSAQQQFEADYKAVLNGREITKNGDRAIRYALNQGEIRNADDVKKAVDDWFSEVEAVAKKPRPRVPHVPTTGEAATDVPNWDEMRKQGGQAAINEYMAERVRGHQAQ